MTSSLTSGRTLAFATLVFFSSSAAACSAGEESRGAQAAGSTTHVLASASAVPHLPTQQSSHAAGAAGQHVAAGDTVHAVVHHSPTCGCCGKWVDHARANGIVVETRLTEDIQSVKRDFTIPSSVQSCHTTIIGGYIVEGHVPADVIRQLLRERPAVRGIAVPGMPMGSPGMEGPYSQRYDIVTFDERGPTGVFARR